MNRCHYCNREEPVHDERCPVPTHDSSKLPKWQLGWSHGFKCGFCLYPEDSCYSLGYDMGSISRKDSERRLSAGKY